MEHIEIFKLAHVGYLIIGIVIAFLAKLTKSNSKSNFDKKVIKILWWTGCVMAGCAGGVLAYFIMRGVLAIIISFILVILGTALITLIIGNIIRKIQERGTKV